MFGRPRPKSPKAKNGCPLAIACTAQLGFNKCSNLSLLVDPVSSRQHCPYLLKNSKVYYKISEAKEIHFKILFRSKHVIDHLVHVTKEIDVGEVAFTGSGPVLTQEMLKQVKNEQWLDIFQNS